MQLTGNYKQYFEAIMLEMQDIIRPINEDDQSREELGQAIWNTIFDLDGPKTVSRVPPQKNTFIADKVFRPLSEILNNLEALERISIYISSFPYKKHGISRLDYLTYHIENYLNEMYILKERLIAYLRQIERSYRGCQRQNEITEILAPVYQMVSSSLSNYVNVRGAHVHQRRYTDTELDRLRSFEVILSAEEDDLNNLLKDMFLREYRKTRRKWAGKIKSDLTQLLEIIEMYFKALCDAFVQENRFVFPSNAVWV